MAEVFVLEEENGVPIDRIYIDEDTTQLHFYLPKGIFNLIITDQNGEVQFNKIISVE